MKQPIYLPKWFYILIYINTRENCTKSNISYNLKISFSQVMNVLKDMNTREWITDVKAGRKTIISLTDKGKEILKQIEQLPLVI